MKEDPLPDCTCPEPMPPPKPKKPKPPKTDAQRYCRTAIISTLILAATFVYRADIYTYHTLHLNSFGDVLIRTTRITGDTKYFSALDGLQITINASKKPSRTEYGFKVVEDAEHIPPEEIYVPPEEASK